jgi:hypothetical protein
MKTRISIVALSTIVATLVACQPPAAITPAPAPTSSGTAASTAATTPTPASTSPAPAASPAASVIFATASAPPATPGGITARLDEPFTLKVSQWANLLDASNTRIFFTSLREDSRCPQSPGINCISIGRALVAITIESAGKLAMFDLSTNPGEFHATGAFNGYVLQLLDVVPYPQQPEPTIALGDYQATLRVSAGSLDVSQARFNVPFTLKLGQATGFDGSTMRLTFVGVTQDSRCPTRVLCVTRGTAILSILATHDSGTESYALEVGGKGVMTSFPAVRTVPVTIYASALTPYPQQEFASKEVASNEYQATLLVINPALPLATPTPR